MRLFIKSVCTKLWALPQHPCYGAMRFLLVGSWYVFMVAGCGCFVPREDTSPYTENCRLRFAAEKYLAHILLSQAAEEFQLSIRMINNDWESFFQQLEDSHSLSKLPIFFFKTVSPPDAGAAYRRVALAGNRLIAAKKKYDCEMRRIACKYRREMFGMSADAQGLDMSEEQDESTKNAFILLPKVRALLNDLFARYYEETLGLRNGLVTQAGWKADRFVYHCLMECSETRISESVDVIQKEASQDSLPATATGLAREEMAAEMLLVRLKLYEKTLDFENARNAYRDFIFVEEGIKSTENYWQIFTSFMNEYRNRPIKYIEQADLKQEMITAATKLVSGEAACALEKRKLEIQWQQLFVGLDVSGSVIDLPVPQTPFDDEIAASVQRAQECAAEIARINKEAPHSAQSYISNLNQQS